MALSALRLDDYQLQKATPSYCIKILLFLYACTHRFVAQSNDIRDGAGSTVLHDNPQVCVLEVAAIVLHHIGTRRKCNREWF